MKHCWIFLIGILIVVGANLPAQEKKTAGVVVDKDAGTVTIAAKMAPRKVIPKDEKVYPLEVIATWPYPAGKKAHETIVNIDESIKPSEVHKALESLGLKAGTPIQGEGEAKGPTINIYFLIPDSTGLDRKVTLDKAMVDANNGKAFPKNVEFRFTGAAPVQPDPNKNEKVYGADWSGTLITIFPVTKETVFQSALPIANERFMKLEVNTKALPKIGTPVKLVLEVKK